MSLHFSRYIGIDYSGAETAEARLSGLRVYASDGENAPIEQHVGGAARYWSRRGVAHWLEQVLSEPVPTIVGIDHGFSFPEAWFATHGVGRDWEGFLAEFCREWPTDTPNTPVQFVRDDVIGLGPPRVGNTRWKRSTERASGGAKSVFHFGVPGQVATSTHAGIPWLRYLRDRVIPRPHFWPFDGWEIPAGQSAIVEVYPRLWNDLYPDDGRTGDQHDAYSVVRWLSEADRSGELARALRGPSDADQRTKAAYEGWILDVHDAPKTPAGRRKARAATAHAPLSIARVLSAAAFAAHKHRDQRRKDVAASPYINHPIAVATVMAVEGGVDDESLLVAALLHDTVEDTETTFEEIEREFGSDVAALVREMTDDKSLSKERRKELQIEHAPAASNRAKQIKIADKICNLRDITHHPPADWTEDRRREYFVWAERVVEGCRGVNARLDRAFDAAVNAASSSPAR